MWSFNINCSCDDSIIRFDQALEANGRAGQLLPLSTCPFASIDDQSSEKFLSGIIPHFEICNQPEMLTILSALPKTGFGER